MNMELYYVLSIVDRNRAKEMQEIYENLQLSVVLTLLGKGTATSEHLSLYESLLSNSSSGQPKESFLLIFPETAL
mgnify:CR=1 FL=1